MGGRGGKSKLSYQGNNGGSGRAASNGTNVSDMKDRLSELSTRVINNPSASEAIAQINSINDKNSMVNIYRATVGDSINKGDWIFLSRAQADNWTRTAFGTPKPGVRVIEAQVRAKDVDWTGKNLEFVYNGRKRKG